MDCTWDISRKIWNITARAMDLSAEWHRSAANVQEKAKDKTRWPPVKLEIRPISITIYRTYRQWWDAINETYETDLCFNMFQPSQALDSVVSIWCPNMVFQRSPCFANLASTSQWLPCWLLVPMGERLATQRCNLDDRRNNGICPSKKKAGKRYIKKVGVVW